jgi:4-amino-4-deoxy-L-arabinose transferase-like glycosyltransferase
MENSAVTPQRSDKWVLPAVFCLALVVNMGLGLKLGLNRPMQSDSYYYYQLAVSLADGKGYVVRDGFWPDSPSMRRLPAWPFLVSLALRVLPSAPPGVVMRVLSLVMNALAAVLIAALTRRIFRNKWATLLSGIAYALYPTALLLAYEGLSEPLFVFTVALGTLLLLSPFSAPLREPPRPPPTVLRPLSSAFGFLCLGCACLVRANFVAWVFFFAPAAVVGLLRAKAPRSRREILPLALGILFFLVPPGLWATRNYRICDAFPVFSALRGQTFYGGNNAVVAGSREYWGYWVFPNNIPGETPMVELAAKMTEYEVDAYYYNKGKEFLCSNPSRIPKLLLGKIVRAYVPVPWKLRLGSVVVCTVRAALYLGFLIGIFFFWHRTEVIYRAIFLAMIATNVFTVLVFYGYSRFTFALEPFLIPFAAMGLVAAAEKLIGKRSSADSGGSLAEAQRSRRDKSIDKNR